MTKKNSKLKGAAGTAVAQTIGIDLVLLCYKRRTPQNGQLGSWFKMWRARAMRSVAMDAGLCRA